MNSFVYQMPVKVYFGERTVAKYLAGELAEVGPTVMIAYGGASAKRTGVYDQVRDVLLACGKEVVDFGGIPANPTYAKVQEGIRLYREKDVDLAIAVGGGSVVDCVKVMCAGVYGQGDLWEAQMVRGEVAERMGRYAVVLTLSGAGAEMDNLGAVTNEETDEKRTFVGPYADFVIEDPAYLMTVPLRAFIPGAYDSLTHCLETYFGKGTNVSDAMNEGLMCDIVANIRRLTAGEDTLEVRSNLMWDASLVQTFLFNVGKPGDFQGHQIENTLGAYSHGTHGRQLAVILPAYYELVWEADVPKFARLARRVFDVSDADDRAAARAGLDALGGLIDAAGLPRTFSEAGYELTDEIAAAVADKAGRPGNGPRAVTRGEVYDLLLSCR